MLDNEGKLVYNDSPFPLQMIWGMHNSYTFHNYSSTNNVVHHLELCVALTAYR